MSKRRVRASERVEKPLVWLHGEIKSPPFSAEARREAGILLGLLQWGESLDMPHSEPLPIVGLRCGALRIRDAEQNWRIMYRVDPDAVVILEVYAKKTRKIPDEVVRICRGRLSQYDAVASARKRRPK